VVNGRGALREQPPVVDRADDADVLPEVVRTFVTRPAGPSARTPQAFATDPTVRSMAAGSSTGMLPKPRNTGGADDESHDASASSRADSPRRARASSGNRIAPTTGIARSYSRGVGTTFGLKACTVWTPCSAKRRGVGFFVGESPSRRRKGFTSSRYAAHQAFSAIRCVRRLSIGGSARGHQGVRVLAVHAHRVEVHGEHRQATRLGHHGRQRSLGFPPEATSGTMREPCRAHPF